MIPTALQYIMHDYRQRGFWICFTLLLFISSSTQTPVGSHISPSISSPLLLLREELVGTIKDLHTSGYSEIEDNFKDLVTQLEHLQVTPGSPLKLEWEHTELNATKSRSICIVVSSFEGLYINSGIGTAYYALAELLARGGHSVTVLYTRDSPPSSGSFSDWVKLYQEQGINLITLPPSDKRISNPKLQVISAQVYQYLKLNPFDVVHFADFEGLGFYSTMAKRIGVDFEKTLFVAGLHGPTRWVLDANEGRIPSHESELEVDWMERMSVENADVVWTPSNFLASWLSTQGWKFSSEVHLLPLPPGPEVRGVHDSVHINAKEFVFFGRLEKRKGLMLFCDSVDLLARMDSVPKKLAITFLGTNGFVDGLDSVEYLRSRSAGWPFKTTFITNATRESALQYLMQRKSGRIPVIPSLVDNAPYTVYECLYAGIPFLASSTPSITPLLAKHEHHLFETKPHHLASRMIHAIKNGLSSAKSVFSANKAEETWMGFYSQLSLPAPAVRSEDLPLVSVCLTHYNRPELVQQAIASISAQDYKRVEVILVDDGSNSTDAIAYLDSIQSTFDKEGWKIIRTANRYLGAARNTAAQQANGKYLLFLDDDNVMFPHQISTYVSVAQKTQANVVSAGHAVFKGVDAPTYESVDRYWLPLGPSLSVGLFKNCFGDANFFVEKSTFDAVGGFTEEHSVGLEEHEFYAKAVFAGYKLEVVPEPLLFYRMHDESNQMVFTLDPRMGEARRIRPYIEALTEKKPEESQKTRRSIVQLVARNAMDTTQDCNQTLSSVTPDKGPITGGTTITLRGVGFSCGVQVVRIDGNECTGLRIVSNYEITCQTPQGTRSYVAVDITADIGGATISLHSSFTYLPSAAPNLQSCQLSNTGATIACSFSSNTDQAPGSCSKFFDSATVSSFGSGANCYWTSTLVLSIDLGQGATIAVGDNIVILAGSVHGQGSTDIVNEAATVQLLGPDAAPNPIASIGSPSTIGSCEGLTLDASASTGGLGRSLTYAWTLVTVNPASADSSAAINAAFADANANGKAKVTIPASDVAVAAYTISLTITNYLGATASTTVTITKSAASVPTVSISGSSLIQINKDAALTLSGSVTSSCGAQLSGSISYSWTISPNVNLDASASSASLTVPANTLSAGTTYTVTFTATDAGVSNSASVSVVVGIRPLVVSVTGGNKQYQISETVSLDGSASHDPEGLADFSFAWSCVSFYDANAPCSVSAPTSAIFSFPATSLGAGKYTVTLTVSGSLGRKESTSVWVEVLEVSVLSIAIEALAEDPVNPAAPLTLTGVLNQPGVSLTEVTWSWSLVSGSLADPSTAYLSTLDARLLVIAANVLSAGSTYTYKLSATQTATGVTGSATISFGVGKAPTTGEFGCAITKGNAEETDFTYDFGAMWGSTSGIASYEIRFIPDGSTLEIPLGEPSTNTLFTTKLPYGKYSIVGVATSGNGVSARKECSAEVTYADKSAGLSALASKAASGGLSPFDVARIAYGAKATFKSVGSSGSNNFANIRASLIGASSAGSSASSVTASTAAFLVLSDPSLGILSQSSLIAAVNGFNALLDAQASTSLNATVLAADVEILSNLVDQLSNQDFDVKVLVKKREAQEDQDLWAAFQTLITASSKVSSQYLSVMANGQSQLTISKPLFTLSLYAASASELANGVTIGKGSTVKLPAGFASADAALALSSWGVSPYPGSSSVVSPVLFLAGSGVNLDSLPAPVTVFVPSGELLDSNNLACVTWSDASANWTEDSCTTTASSGGVTCQCSTVRAVAVARSASSRASTGGDDDGGLSSTVIGVIAGVGGVALIAVIVGSVIGVKRHRARHAADAAGPAPANPEPVVLSTDAVAVPVAAAVPGTPASQFGSSYSSSSSRSIVSSASSEEEVMEQQIKDIVGELSTALPRDPRALEVLGDRLDLE